MRLQDWLKKELKVRKKRNKYYSMRAFAKYLSVSPATLSGVLLGRRALSKKFARKILREVEQSVDQVEE